MGRLTWNLFRMFRLGYQREHPSHKLRWTVRVTPDQFGADGAVFKFPFQSVHPEFDLKYGPWGVVHAKLSVPGNGTFEASDSMVRIRPYSEVRDRSQQINGQRFFNTERVERWGR